MSKKLIGPFTELLTMDNLPERGRISDDDLTIQNNAGILLEGDVVLKTGDWKELSEANPNAELEPLDHPAVGMPGFIDSHTHICYGGTRQADYALRIAGVSYLEIAKRGGGIQDTVKATRKASLAELTKRTMARADQHLQKGITTCEVKSGYGLSTEHEMKMLEAIQQADRHTPADLIPTCLAAHTVPKDFNGSTQQYLDGILNDLLLAVKENELAGRVDVFIEESAFSPEQGLRYLQKAHEMGFTLTIHGDQFTSGGSQVAIEVGAISVDHLEASTDEDILKLGQSRVIGTALPGASMGLGCAFTKARKLLDAGGRLAIATDWNPGSAPMGDLLTQAAVLSTFEKLSTAETLAGITLRAAQALALSDRGVLSAGKKADVIAFPTDDHRNILYHQGQLRPHKIWKNGHIV